MTPSDVTKAADLLREQNELKTALSGETLVIARMTPTKVVSSTVDTPRLRSAIPQLLQTLTKDIDKELAALGVSP